MKKCIDILIVKFKLVLLKLRYPKAGWFTRLVLVNGTKMEEIDEWVKEREDEFSDCETIYDRREEVCEIEVGYWEN